MSPANGQEYIPEPLRTVARIKEVAGVRGRRRRDGCSGKPRVQRGEGGLLRDRDRPGQREEGDRRIKKMVEGSYLEPGDRDGIMIGAEIAGDKDNGARHLSFTGVGVGDRLTLVRWPEARLHGPGRVQDQVQPGRRQDLHNQGGARGHRRPSSPAGEATSSSRPTGPGTRKRSWRGSRPPACRGPSSPGSRRPRGSRP